MAPGTTEAPDVPGAAAQVSELGESEARRAQTAKGLKDVERKQD